MPTALVMGASGDIGEAICRQLAQEGWSLYCHYHRNEKKVLNFVLDLQKCYPLQDFFMVSLDMLSMEEIPKFTQGLFQVDSVIFASGFTKYALFKEYTELDMDQLWQIHVKSPLLLLQRLSSMETVYSAVKGAQQAFVKAYAKEVATLGITANVIAPGAVATAMNQDWSKTELTELKEAIPLGRLAQPKEIAAAVTFLLQKEAAYVTGITLPVTGGWLE